MKNNYLCNKNIKTYQIQFQFIRIKSKLNSDLNIFEILIFGFEKNQNL